MIRSGAALVVLLAGAYVVLLRMKWSTPADCSWKLDMAAVRAAAGALPGDEPIELREESVAEFRLPEAAVCPGCPWSKVVQRVFVYQLVYGDRSVVIDTGMNEEQTKAVLGAKASFDREAWEHAREAMRKASAIYVTHEHPDHLGGLTVAPPEVLARAHISQEQLDHLDRLGDIAVPDAVRSLEPSHFSQVHALAPGLVLVKAPGHTPGSQLFFIRLHDGKELLIAGDTAWRMVNIEQKQGPPRLVSLIEHGDPEMTQCQLSALARLDDEGRVAILPGHDGDRMLALERAGIVLRGLR